jgi:hypothetical protein
MIVAENVPVYNFTIKELFVFRRPYTVIQQACQRRFNHKQRKQKCRPRQN